MNRGPQVGIESMDIDSFETDRVKHQGLIKRAASRKSSKPLIESAAGKSRRIGIERYIVSSLERRILGKKIVDAVAFREVRHAIGRTYHGVLHKPRLPGQSNTRLEVGPAVVL